MSHFQFRQTLRTARWSLVLAVVTASFSAHAADDHRVYQHGIDFVPLNQGKYGLVWSSAGNPPIDDWIHDIYYSFIDPASPSIDPVTLLSNPEAQEPASAAATSDGHIMVTMEDGWNANNEVAQRYGVYDSQFAPVLAYPQMVEDGGHSGHVAAVGNRFVVFYSEGWVDGGGVDNLGSGDDVKAMIYDSKGKEEKFVSVAMGNSTRDWWPLVAGSPTKACLVWQRFVDGATQAKLMMAMLDPATGKLTTNPTELFDKVVYYTYSVEYASSIDRFLVRATTQSGGVGYLIDNEGQIQASRTDLSSVVRESQSVIRNDKSSALAVQPRSPKGLSLLRLTTQEIEVLPAIDDDYAWDYIGTDGIFLNETQVYMASLSTKGIVTKTFSVPGEEVEPELPDGGPNPEASTPPEAGPDSSSKDGGTTSDADTKPVADAATSDAATSDAAVSTTNDDDSSGCDCSMKSSRSSRPLLLLGLVAFLVRARGRFSSRGKKA